MKKNLSNDLLAIKIQADKPVVAREDACVRIIEVIITPPSKQAKEKRSPLNISLVLDHSGSMHGEKLAYVKQAAAHVMDLLDPEDQVSVTIYDDEVDTLLHSHKATDRFKLDAKRKIQEVQSGGSTYLSGGWLRGCEEAAGKATGSSINRTLLLTDGLANCGIEDLEELATHSRELFRRGIATSCFGVGHDYNEHLLEAMANAGGGTFHYLETVNAIPLEFEREFNELVSVTLRETELGLVIPEGVEAKVSAGYSSEMRGDELSITLGSLYSGKETRVYITLSISKRDNHEPFILTATVRGKGEGDYVRDDTASLNFSLVSSSEESAQPQDQSLMERFAVVDMADKANEAIKRERAGDRDGASQLMQSSIKEHHTNMPASMIDKYEFLTQGLQIGLSESERKRYHQEEYFTKRGRDFVRDYRLKVVNGHMIARIEDRFILIDSGVETSFGIIPEWFFLNEVHKLPSSFQGVYAETISQMIGTQVDVVMGTDIMQNMNVSFEPTNELITFGLQSSFNLGKRIPLKNFKGVPVAKALINKSAGEVFIASGAKLSYVDQAIAADFSPEGTAKDFYPGIGEFETKVYRIPFMLGGAKFELRCGVLPSQFESTILTNGKRGILGVEFFEKFKVTLALPDHSMFIK